MNKEDLDKHIQDSDNVVDSINATIRQHGEAHPIEATAAVAEVLGTMLGQLAALPGPGIMPEGGVCKLLQAHIKLVNDFFGQAFKETTEAKEKQAKEEKRSDELR